MVVAVLVLVGTVVWLHAITDAFVGLDRVVRTAIWLAAGFIGTQVARRVLGPFALGETAIAALVACATVLGIFATRTAAPRLGMMWPFGAIELGALLGALTSRHPEAPAATLWRGLAAGFITFGATMVAAGIVNLALDGDYLVLAFGIGGVVGSAAAVRSSAVRLADCMGGVGLVLGASGSGRRTSRLASCPKRTFARGAASRPGSSSSQAIRGVGLAPRTIAHLRRIRGGTGRAMTPGRHHVARPLLSRHLGRTAALLLEPPFIFSAVR